MIIREAILNDISQMSEVRLSVKENVLSNPQRFQQKDYEEFLFERGKGWVAENSDGQIVGFAIVDLTENNVWALFIRPEFESKGIGKKLHDAMLDWYFSMTEKTIWLSTDLNTRASFFYEKSGWRRTGLDGVELFFEMDFEGWKKKKQDG